jgi:hypothetical protein
MTTSEKYLRMILGYVAGAHVLAWGLDKLWWWYVDGVPTAAKGTRRQGHDRGRERAALRRGPVEGPRGETTKLKATRLLGARD